MNYALIAYYCWAGAILMVTGILRRTAIASFDGTDIALLVHTGRMTVLNPKDTSGG